MARARAILLIIAALAAVAVPRGGAAQQQAAVAARIDVASAVSVFNLQDLWFGDIAVGTSSTVTNTQTGSGSTPHLGKAYVRVQQGKPVYVDIASPAVLRTLDATEIIQFTPQAAYNGAADDAAASMAVTLTAAGSSYSGTAYFKPQGSVQGGPQKQGWIYVYGTVVTTGSTTPGLYRALVTLTVHY